MREMGANTDPATGDDYAFDKLNAVVTEAFSAAHARGFGPPKGGFTIVELVTSLADQVILLRGERDHAATEEYKLRKEISEYKEALEDQSFLLEKIKEHVKTIAQLRREAAEKAENDVLSHLRAKLTEHVKTTIYQRDEINRLRQEISKCMEALNDLKGNRAIVQEVATKLRRDNETLNRKNTTLAGENDILRRENATIRGEYAAEREGLLARLAQPSPSQPIPATGGSPVVEVGEDDQLIIIVSGAEEMDGPLDTSPLIIDASMVMNIIVKRGAKK